MPYWFESKYNLNPTVNDANNDKDSDLITNYQEFLLNFDPTNKNDGLNDSDNDKMPNGWEIQYGLNPFDSSDAFKSYDGDFLTNQIEYDYNFNPVSVNDRLTDYDNDGLVNSQEIILQLNPNDPDTDNDGFSDFAEVNTFGFFGSSPRIATDTPLSKLISWMILAGVIYFIGLASYLIYTDRTETLKLKREKELKEMQTFIDVINNSAVELENQINTIEEAYNTTSAKQTQFPKLEKSIVTLSDSVSDLEGQKNKLHTYRYHPELKDSVTTTISQIERIINQYMILKKKITGDDEKIVLKDSSDNFCSNCFTILPATATECTNCKTKIKNCAICRKGLFSGQEISACPLCENQFHHGHFAESVKIQGRCPICKGEIAFDEIKSWKI